MYWRVVILHYSGNKYRESWGNEHIGCQCCGKMRADGSFRTFNGKTNLYFELSRYHLSKMELNDALLAPLTCGAHVSSLSLFAYRMYAQVWRLESCAVCFDAVKNIFFHFYNAISSEFVVVRTNNLIATQVRGLYLTLTCLHVQNKRHVGNRVS